MTKKYLILPLPLTLHGANKGEMIMGKEKAKILKPKTTGMDIFYRIVMALAALAVPIAAVFCKLIHFIVESDLFALIAELQGNTEDTGATEDKFSIYYVWKTFGDGIRNAGADGSGNVWESVSEIHAPIIATLVFFAIAIVIALVIFFFSCFSNKKKIPLALSAAGIVSVICMYISFNAVASPIVAGDISLGVFFESSIVSAILPYIASFSLLRLSDAFFVMLFLYIGMAVWAGANIIINLDDAPKTPKKSNK